MKRVKNAQPYLLLIAILGVAAIVGCAGATADLVAPTVSATVPAHTATGVAVDSVLTATFSEAMMPDSMIAENFTLGKGADRTPVAGTVTYDDVTATFTPLLDLDYETGYTATITTGARDLPGNSLENEYVWTFVTADAPDLTAPVVTSILPANLAVDRSVSPSIRATFSEDMDPATILAASFTLADGVTPVAGTVTYDLPSKTARFAPTVVLDLNTEYTVTVTTGAKDLSGNGLAANKVWTFTTIAAPPAGPAPVLLGTAGNFAILAKTAITTVPASAITGDIGLSPAAESDMTGFSQTKATGYSTSPQVTGFIYAADMTPPTPSNMTTAISDMETAYTDAAGRIDDGAGPVDFFLNLGTGTISGNTLTPGLYRWASVLNITGNITISGAANDVWIFQITGDLILANDMDIILSGGAQAKNIFWQMAGYAELGTGSHFEGIILSQTQVNLLTGASMNGRALAQSQVTLDQSVVTEPSL